MSGVSQRSGNGTIAKKKGTNTTMNCKQTLPVEVEGWDMKIGVTISEVNKVAVASLELQEPTALLVLVEDLEVVMALETKTNIEMVETEQDTKADLMAIWVIYITLFPR